MNRRLFFAAAGLALGVLGAGRALGPLFLIDDTHKPTVTISWPTVSGGATTLKAEVGWTSTTDRTVLGHNLEVFACLGGTRLDKGAGNPAGAIVRTGFYKTDVRKPMFEDIADKGAVTIVMTNILFNRPAVAMPTTALQHLKYMPEDAAVCGLGDTGLDQYNTADASDTLHGKITVANARLGVLDGSSTGAGSVKFDQAATGEITMTAVIPYALFRHVRDPWQRTNPGTFFEPTHFHVEVEILPKDVAEQLAKQDPAHAQ
jgi:hypothetical protein